MKKFVLFVFVFFSYLINDAKAASYITSTNVNVVSTIYGDTAVFKFFFRIENVNDLDLTMQSFRKDPSTPAYLYPSGVVYGIYNEFGALVQSGTSTASFIHLYGASVSGNVATIQEGNIGLFEFTSVFKPEQSGLYRARLIQTNTVETLSRAGLAFVDFSGLSDKTDLTSLSVPEPSTLVIFLFSFILFLRRRR